MLDSKQKGNLNELQCITSFYELGYKISIPYGENSRYDFIADVDGKLYKIQCKTSRLKDSNSFHFSCCSTRTNSTKNIRNKYDKTQIDFFCTYFQGRCYLVPVEECSDEKTLRFNPPKNNQKTGVNFAMDYELETSIEKYILKKN